MAKEDSKSPESEISGDIVGTLTMLLTEVDDEAELSQEFPTKEEKIEEIMRELYKEITTSHPPSKLPSPSSSLPFGVKSESCGASVSASGSTVMAGNEYVGVGPAGKMVSGKVGMSENGSCVGEKMDGCDVLDAGDEWLARVLRWGPQFEIEEFT